jgi:hypothetical protein
MPGITAERLSPLGGRRVALMSQSRSQIRSHTLHMPNADVDEWTSYRDSRSRCTRQPGALYNLDKVEVRKWLTWVTFPFTGRFASLEERRKLVAGIGKILGPSPSAELPESEKYEVGCVYC